MMDTFIKEYGSIDFAINNAGIANTYAAEEISSKDFKKVVDINLNGVFLTAQAAARQMIKEGKAGSIVNTASMSAHIINTPQTIANYCASKGGVLLLTKALAVEWAKYNIRVNCVSPGRMDIENPGRSPRCAGRPYRSLFIPVKRCRTLHNRDRFNC